MTRITMRDARCPGSLRLAFIGALSVEKRPGLAIEAVGMLPGARLEIVGAGPLQDDLEQLAEQRAPGRVHFHGVLDDVDCILVRSDVVLNTSSTEGVSNALIEAGLSGAVSVATDVGGSASVIVDDVTGVLVATDCTPAELAHAIRRASDLTTPPVVIRDHVARTFDMDVVADRWQELLRRIGGLDR
jgi:glycosyltransferase involved in cell wall biosynthesis